MRTYMQAKGPLYRSRNGVLLGVCKGVAEYFGFSVFWVRALMLLAFLFSGFWPIMGVYILAALLMNPRPVRPIENEDEQEFYDSYVNSPRGAAQRLKRKFESLDKRIRRMEDKVTAKDYDWERRFNS